MAVFLTVMEGSALSLLLGRHGKKTKTMVCSTKFDYNYKHFELQKPLDS